MIRGTKSGIYPYILKWVRLASCLNIKN
ncbi:hypothetical protein ACJIZ3_011611 [Penstemon smallii]|uniref:Uncharacterized protein n=1 Tax=Penstemon smallii TaxID=265156 RepID=A0ABD3UJM0_9LAMI